MSFKTVRAHIGGIQTDIAVSEFSDNYFILLTQFEKIGTVISVKKDSLETAEGDQIVYSIKTELGDEEGPGHIVARFVTEQLNLSKPAVFSVSLKDSSLPTLRALVQVLRKLYTW